MQHYFIRNTETSARASEMATKCKIVCIFGKICFYLVYIHTLYATHYYISHYMPPSSTRAVCLAQIQIMNAGLWILKYKPQLSTMLMLFETTISFTIKHPLRYFNDNKHFVFSTDYVGTRGRKWTTAIVVRMEVMSSVYHGT